MFDMLWVAIIAFGVIMYVILDGFDLGTGIIIPLIKNEHHRDIIISSILPVWDGNETWLVFGGAALYGAFPLAFSLLLPTLYLPLMIMVIALLFRGVSFEFRLKADESHKKFWDYCFFSGSILTAFVQGLILGAFVHGFYLPQDGQTIPPYQWLSPFSLFCGVAVILGYILLGSNWLIAKTIGELRELCFKVSKTTQYLVFSSVIIVSFWSPYLNKSLLEFWFNKVHFWYLWPLPTITLILFLIHRRSVNRKNDFIPFWSSVGIFLMCYVGFILSTFPYLVPPTVTYKQAAAQDSTLLFMLIGACIMMPILLYYTYYSYKVFKGKVTQRLEY